MDTLFDAHLRNNDDEPVSLTIMDVKGAFFVLVTGLVIATLSYLFELVYVMLENILFNGKYGMGNRLNEC